MAPSPLLSLLLPRKVRRPWALLPPLEIFTKKLQRGPDELLSNGGLLSSLAVDQEAKKVCFLFAFQNVGNWNEPLGDVSIRESAQCPPLPCPFSSLPPCQSMSESLEMSKSEPLEELRVSDLIGCKLLKLRVPCLGKKVFCPARCLPPSTFHLRLLAEARSGRAVGSLHAFPVSCNERSRRVSSLHLGTVHSLAGKTYCRGTEDLEVPLQISSSSSVKTATPRSRVVHLR